MRELFEALGAAGCAVCDGVTAPPVGSAPIAESLSARLCSACLAEVPLRLAPLAPPPTVTRAWSLASYAGPVGALLRSAKYGGRSALLSPVGLALRDAALVEALGPYSAVVPVPTTTWRRLLRGGNPAERLAAPLARALGTPMPRPLRRVRGRPQAGTARADRPYNARGSYLARSDWRGEGPVLLVDDVLTTGATADACATELLCAGASRVDLLVAAASTRPRTAES